MFRASSTRLRAWLKWAEDVLADSLDDAQANPHNFHTHPHRRALRWDRARRPGTVAARPAHCISPLRSRSAFVDREAATR